MKIMIFLTQNPKILGFWRLGFGGKLKNSEISPSSVKDISGLKIFFTECFFKHMYYARSLQKTCFWVRRPPRKNLCSILVNSSAPPQHVGISTQTTRNLEVF